MYLSYEKYQSMGGALDEPTFNEYEFTAETVVDWYTFNRLHNETEYPAPLERLMYALIHLIQIRMTALDSNSGVTAGGTGAAGGIIKQSNDGVSTEYNMLSAGDVLNASDGEVAKMIKFYLQGVMNSLGRKLLYRGLYPGE